MVSFSGDRAARVVDDEHSRVRDRWQATRGVEGDKGRVADQADESTNIGDKGADKPTSTTVPPLLSRGLPGGY